MSGIVWMNPPEVSGGRYSTKWQSIVDQLKKRPGEYALVATDVSRSIPQYLKLKYGLEVTVRGTSKTDQTVAELYARYPKEKR